MRELDLIRTIAEKAARTHHPFLQKGIGDDCAIFSSMPSADWLVTTDMLVEDVHFDTSWHSPYLLGRKSLAVNLSDIAAMGGVPQFVLLGLAIPGKYGSSWLERYMDGFFSLLNDYNCLLIGGDTVSSDKLTLAVTVLGTVPQGKALRRDGAAIGDVIYVSGPLGSAAAGLHLCRSGHVSAAAANPDWQPLLDRHLNPAPRVRLAHLLQASGCVTAMLDISDGIATDLSHICTASGVAAVIEEQALPAHEALSAMCRQLRLDPVQLQIAGGDDYELLFTVKSGCEEELVRRVRSLPGEEIYRIGRITEGQGVTMLTGSGELVSIDYQGYEHHS